MRYVMVPVPSEYVLDVMRWVLFRAADEDASALKQDEDRVLELIRDADEFTRSLLAVVAAARTGGRRCDDCGAGEDLGTAERPRRRVERRMSRSPATAACSSCA